MTGEEIFKILKDKIGTIYNKKEIAGIIAEYEKEQFEENVLVVEVRKNGSIVEGYGRCAEYVYYKSCEDSDIFKLYVDVFDDIVNVIKY